MAGRSLSNFLIRDSLFRICADTILYCYIDPRKEMNKINQITDSTREICKAFFSERDWQ